jgi:hypothetical protein
MSNGFVMDGPLPGEIRLMKAGVIYIEDTELPPVGGPGRWVSLLRGWSSSIVRRSRAERNTMVPIIEYTSTLTI